MDENLDFLNTDQLPGLIGESTPTPPLVVTETTEIKDVSTINEHLVDDLNLTRATLRAQQEIMLQVAKEFAKTAMTAEHPKVIEALGTFMGHLTKNATALVDMHKSAKDAAGPGVVQQQNQQINAENVFIGTPTDLLDHFGTRQDSKKQAIEGEYVEVEEDNDRAKE